MRRVLGFKRSMRTWPSVWGGQGPNFEELKIIERELQQTTKKLYKSNIQVAIDLWDR